MNDLTYWKKQEKPLYKDLEWNFPEQKQNSVAVIGGNSQSFSAPIKASEFLSASFPIKTVKTILPDSLKSKFPPALALENLSFMKSTPSGSFDKSEELAAAIDASDFALFIGDFSKNSVTASALKNALENSDKTPALIARDAVDLLTPEFPELIERENLFIFASLAQLQKLFRAVYFPKVLLLSQPLLQIIETLHKFTLSYPTTLITFHEGQIIVANHGKIVTTPLSLTEYSPISLFLGNLPAKIVAENLWNPKKPLEATSAAVLQ